MFRYFYAFLKSIFNKLSKIKFLFIALAFLLSCSSNSFLASTKEEELKSYDLIFDEFNQKFINIKEYTKEDVLKALEESKSEVNPILYLYEQEATHNLVIDFFARFVGNKKIALSILSSSYLVNVSVALTFAIAWTESDFESTVVNQNPDSLDRGLFQLNSKTFKYLRQEDFFNLEVNTRNGIRFIKTCFKQAEGYGSEREKMALYMYNAGPYRVLKGNVPNTTKVYAKKILERKEYIKKRFYNFMSSKS